MEESALVLICANADGSVRDGLSLLDQCISGGGTSVSRDEVLELIGASGEEVLMELTDYVTGGQVARALLLLNRVLADGKDVRQLMKDWIEHFRSLLMTKYIKHPEEVLNLSTENVERIRSQSERLSLPVINNSILELSKTLADAKWSTQPRVLLELAIVRLGSGDGVQPLSQRMAVQPIAAVPSPPSQEAVPRTSMTQEATAGLPPEGEGSDAVDDVPPWEWPEDAAVAAEQHGSQPQVEALDLELEDLWFSIFDDPSVKKGSFLLLRMGSKLRRVTDSQFFVEATNNVTRDLLKSNEALLSRMMEQKTGRKLRMVLQEETVGSQEDDREKKAQELARSLGDKLGINVEVR